MSTRSASYGILIGLVSNAFLLVIKACASGVSDSLAIFSETMNSLADFIGAIVILIFVRWAHRSKDDDHPFGHGRAEPIAGLLLSIFSGILGFEVVRVAVMRLVAGTEPHHVGLLTIAALSIAIMVKSVLAGYFFRLGRLIESPAFGASAVDCRSDVLVGGQALLGVLLAQDGHRHFRRNFRTARGNLYSLLGLYHCQGEH